MARSCIFCGSTGEMSREHVIPQWLEGELTNGQTASYIGTHFAPLFSHEISNRKASKNSHTFKQVCGSCNNGWMSKLEVDFKGILPRLVQDINPRAYSKTERQKIASWVFKTAMIGHHSANYKEILPIGLAREFFGSFNLPKSLVIHIGRMMQRDSLVTSQSSFNYAVLSKESAYNVDLASNSFQYSIGFLNLFLRLSWHSFDCQTHRSTMGNLTENQFYPHPERCATLKEYDDIFDVGLNIYLREL